MLDGILIICNQKLWKAYKQMWGYNTNSNFNDNKILRKKEKFDNQYSKIQKN